VGLKLDVCPRTKFTLGQFQASWIMGILLFSVISKFVIVSFAEEVKSDQ